MMKNYKFALFLVITITLTILTIGVFADGEWVSINDVIVNGAYSTEVGIGQTLTIDIITSTGPIPNSTSAVIGIDVYNASGYVTSFTNQTSTMTPLNNYTFGFNGIISLATGDYTATVFIQYDKNGTNETIYSNTSFRVISLTPVSLGVAHGDAAYNETVNFLQGIQNNGNESANATVKVWIWYDFNNNSLEDAGEKYATEPPTKDKILGSELKDISVLWATPTELGDCTYTNASLRSIYSAWAYGNTASRSGTGLYLTNFNITYVEVDTYCPSYCHSGLSQTEVAPGGEITGSVRLLNRGADATTVHEVTAWVEDQDGTKWLTLGAIGSLNTEGYPRYYKDNIVPGHNSTCTDSSSNHTIADQGSLSFSFQGVLPANLPTGNTYEVVYAIDYGVPRDMLGGGQPYNILKPYDFELVNAEVLDIETLSEVTYNAVLNINTIINNTGITIIDDLSVYVDIYNSSGYNERNFTGAYPNTPAGSTINSSSPWTIPSTGINLGNYYINATATFGNGGTSSLSVPFEIVYLATLDNDTIADPIAPYETKNISIFVQNQGPTNATMKLINATINAASSVPLGTFSNTEIANNTIYAFNFSYYFDPTGLTNGSFGIEVDEEFGERSFSYSPANITFLPVGIKSFTVPSAGANTSAVPISITLTNIGSSNVSVSINISSNISGTLNQTTVTAANNSDTTVNYNIAINQTGTHNITITANYTGLPQPLVRNDIIQISSTATDLSINSSGISPSPSSPTTGQNVSITATVDNLGTGDANGVKVEFLLDGVSQANNTLSVANSSSNSTVFYWTAVVGTHNITIVADPDNSITGELNETNNNATTSVVVAAVATTSTGGDGGGPAYLPATEPSYLRSDVNLTGTGITDMVYQTGDALASTKYVLHSKFAALAGVFASGGEVVISQDTGALLFDEYADSNSGNIIEEEPSLLEAGVYELAADYVLSTGRASIIVIARGDVEADSIAASTFTHLVGGKMLLVKPDDVPYATAQALRKIRPSKIYIIGGENAISPEVEKEIGKYTYNIERLGGKDRYETSLLLAEEVREMSDATIAVVTDGKNPVAYAATLAVRFNSPVVYIDESSPEKAEEFLKDFKVEANLY